MRGKYWVQVWQGSLNVPALGSFDVVADFLAGYANLPAMLPTNGPVRSSLYTCLSLSCCLMGMQPLLPVLLACESTLAMPQSPGSKAADLMRQRQRHMPSRVISHVLSTERARLEASTGNILH